LLHPNAGEYRRCLVKVSDHEPVDHWRVDAHMEDFINYVNYFWQGTDAVTLAAFTLWRLNYIHPFINGNGRTSRAVCYFILCVKAGGLLGGTTILPELLRREHPRYVQALKDVDDSLKAAKFDLAPVHKIVSELLDEQLKS
jgi:Fic family protein